MKYRPDVDGLRAVAVTLVVLFHAKLGFPGGYVGVDVFFVISGFLITGLLERDLDSGKFSIAAFWDRRIRRIVPALTVNVIVTLLVGWLLLLPVDVVELSKSAIAQVFMCANIYFWKSTGYFDGPAEMKPLLHMWSLAVEEQFYLIFPPAFLVLRRRFRQHSTLALCGTALGSLCLCEYGLSWRPAAAYFLLPTRAWELLAGCLLALHLKRFPGNRMLHELSGIIGLLLIVASGLILSPSSRFPGLTAFPSCLGAVLVIAAGQSENTSVFRILSAKPLVAVGLISYSLYLWHWPVLVFVQYWGMGITPWRWRLAAVVISLLLAAASTLWIEAWFRGSRWPRPVPAPITFCLGGLTLVTTLCVAFLQQWQPVSPLMSERALSLAAGVNDKAFITECNVADVQSTKLPTLGSPLSDSVVDVVIWGDSHAMAAAPAVDAAARNLKLAGLIATHSATPPLLSFVSSSPFGLGRQNLQFSTAVIQMVEQADRPVVVMVALWSFYYAENPGLFKTALAETLSRLSSARVPVILLLEVPKQQYAEIPKALARAEIFGEAGQLGVSVQEHRQRVYSVQALIRQLAEQYPSIQVLDPEECYCNSSGFCAAEADGASIYRDSHHLTVQGSMRMVSLIEAALRNAQMLLNQTVQIP